MKSINFEKFLVSEKLRIEFSKLDKIEDKWDFFRKIYKFSISQILDTAEKDISKWAHSYTVDWISFFSPLEHHAWNIIRCQGNIVLYPQFPVLRYFIDFANPYLKIGVELDSKKYHDLNRDRLRDKKLYDKGWKIFRISSRETYNEYKDLTELQELNIEGEKRKEELINWIFNTCDGVIFAIKVIYFLPMKSKENYINFKLFDDDLNVDNYETINLVSLCKLSLANHNLVGFKI